MATHIVDEEYRGHELVFIMQDDGWITVDIRIDNFDGEFMGGYTDMLDVHTARVKATGYIDGFYHDRGYIATRKMEATPYIKRRLEYLRQELRDECISYGELAELQSLAGYIESGDVELLEAAGVPE